MGEALVNELDSHLFMPPLVERYVGLINYHQDNKYIAPFIITIIWKYCRSFEILHGLFLFSLLCCYFSFFVIMNQDTSGIKTTTKNHSIRHFPLQFQYYMITNYFPTLELITGMFRYIYLSYVVLIYSCTLLSLLSYVNECVHVWIIMSVFAMFVNIDMVVLSLLMTPWNWNADYPNSLEILF